MRHSLLLFVLVLTSLAWATPPANDDEARVGAYTLPDPLRMADGRPVISPEQWDRGRRPELLRLFQEHVYGRPPEMPVTWSARLQSAEAVFGGKAMRLLVDLNLQCQNRELVIPLLIYRPPGEGPWPVILGMNFCGNQSVYPDAGIPLCQGWVHPAKDIGIHDNRATDESRGGRAGRWPVEAIISRGYAICTLAYGDAEPDAAEVAHSSGVHALLGQAGDWGSIAAWAWTLSQVADFLVQEPWVDRLAVLGHSRLGKAALWAGANDPRFGLVISNNSGCGGAALSRREFGETVATITESFPHWFAPRFASYAGKESMLPVDQHELLALMAGRCVYVASAQADLWADPEGERLAVEAARPVFELVGGAIGYHRRPGQHNVTPFDWERFLDFADKHWKPARATSS
jgi:hypothetical protein